MRRFALLLLFVCLASGVAEAATVTLTWDPNQEADLSGYILSYGTSSNQYTGSIDVGNTTTYVFTPPDPTRVYYLALQAYNAAGRSPYSNEVATTAGPLPLTVTNLAASANSPQVVGATIGFTATATGGVPPYQYKWWIFDGTTSTIGQNWSTSSTFTWRPTVPNPNYRVTAWARNASSTVDNFDNPAATLAMTFAINPVSSLTVSGVTPNTGPTSGGTSVTIAGTNFLAGATVSFGGTAATNINVVASSSITAITPAHAVGTANVVVTNPGSPSATLTNGFTYGNVVTQPISFIQMAAAVPQSSPASVSVAYPAVQTAGDMNVVVVGWNDAVSTVQTVRDSANNLYSLAIGPTTGTGLRQSIYYAPNVAGGSNTVTVTFNQATPYPDVRILEYRGVLSLDVTAGASGSGNAADSGAALTTSANELIVGASTVAALTTAAGTNFTSRVITSPNGDLAEDRIVSATGTYSAVATLTGNLPWVMQMATFKSGGSAPGPAPTLSGVTPNSGSTLGGTSITLTGSNFATGATVTVGGVAATSVVVASGTSLTARVPAHAAGAVPVVVKNPDNQTATLANGFTYTVTAPTVGGVLPNSGSTLGGTTVTITGTNFVTGATVSIGGAPATSVVVVNSTSITARTPAHTAGVVAVTVTNPNTEVGSLNSAFTYASTTMPTVGGVVPNSVSTLGGTTVTITGTNFVAGATVTVGGTAASNVIVNSPTSISARTPAHAAGAAIVTVTNPNTEAGSLTNGFTYVSTAPTVTGISPGSGSLSGGTAVTITGTNFVTGATVSIGGAAATSVVVVNSTSITARTPAHTAGAVAVTVTNPNTEIGSLNSAFTYASTTMPTVGSVVPNSGSTLGGTTVTIAGTNFVAGATVTVGGTAASNVIVNSPTSISARTPAHAAGAAIVTVTNPNAEAGSLTNGFTYVSTAPVVTSVSPSSGPTSGGTTVTIVGTGFATGATVSVGGVAATGVVVLNSTSITATTPAHAAGAVSVLVTNPGSPSGTLTNGFTYGSVVTQPISFVQVAAAVPQAPTAALNVAYPVAQTAGDLNVVVVGWNNATSTVSSVQDNLGNVYKLAIGPTTGTGLRQSIYYAAGIVAGVNTVTVTFNQATAYPDVRLLEYRGVSTLDVVAGASGSGNAASSGTATTTAPNELIVGANTVAGTTTGAGSSFTSRIITSPDADIAEDRIVTAVGSYSASATLTLSLPWVMQMVTFK